MKTPHKHAELIKAWADGAEIEYLHQRTDTWLETENPDWLPSLTYRIKPAPKPDVVEWHCLSRNGCAPTLKPTIKLTFSGEDGKLTEAEVL